MPRDLAELTFERAGPAPFEPLLDIRQAARLLHLHAKTVGRWAREGRIPGIHYSKRWFFRASELDAWVRSQVNLPRHACRQSEELDEACTLSVRLFATKTKIEGT